MMEKFLEQLVSEDFSPGEIWAFWFLTIAFSGAMVNAALVSELGMAWGWSIAVMVLTVATGLGIADFKEWRQEDYLERKQVERQKRALAKLDAEDAEGKLLQDQIDEELNGPV